MPKWMLYIAVIVLTALLIPPALIAQRRSVLTEKPRIHLVLDMDNQHRFEAQASTQLFADGRSMRPPVEGAVARGELREDEHMHRGIVDDGWATVLPDDLMPVDRAMVDRGRERFNIYCAPCHGESGYGGGIIHQRATRLVAAGINGTSWVAPKSLHDEDVRSQPVGRIYNTITNGVRNMAGYEAQIPVEDRWAIVAYIEALQRSQSASIDDVPASDRGRLPEVPLPEEAESDASTEENGSES